MFAKVRLFFHIPKIPTSGCPSAFCSLSIRVPLAALCGGARGGRSAWAGARSGARLCVEDVEEIAPEKVNFVALSHLIRLLFCVKVCKRKPRAAGEISSLGEDWLDGMSDR